MNNEQNTFVPTGKMIPMPKNIFTQAVNFELENFKGKLLNGDPNPVPNPFTESLVVSNNGSNVMVPKNIQNETIASYLSTDPQLRAMMDNTTVSSRRPLVESAAFNQSRHNDTKEYDDNREHDEDIYILSIKNTNKNNTMILLVLCIIVAGLLIFFCRKKLNLM